MSHLSPERLAALIDEQPTAAELAHLAACRPCARERGAYEALAAMSQSNGSIGKPLTSWDRLAPALDTALEKIMRDFAEKAGPDWTLQPGKMVFEVRPSRASKGDAVASFLEQAPFAGRLPIAVGDDLTDESMFALANARGGQSIRVGSLSHATCALARASSPSAIRTALATVAAGEPAASGIAAAR